MGIAQTPHSVQLFTGLLSQVDGVREVEDLLIQKWGPVEDRSPVVPFSYSQYYEDEFGKDLVRWICVFEKNISPEEIMEYKLQSNKIEQDAALGGSRKWNIDPGYIDLDKVVLATTKPATYRIYLGKGIYAQSTLFYKDESFRPWSWTYPDYRDEFSILFFNKTRDKFKKTYQSKQRLNH